MLIVGIDISKASFNVAALIEDGCKNRCFDNNSKGFKELTKWLKTLDQQAVCCMEATGVYGIALAKHLHQRQIKVIVANPIATKNFYRMEMSRNKTDKTDAQSIAGYCKHIVDNGELEANIYTPKSQSFEDLQYLVARLDQLDKTWIAENNRLQVSQDKTAIKTIKSMLKHIDKQIEIIKNSINKLLKEDVELNRQINLLKSINGIGDKTAWVIVACLGDISLFKKANQVVSYAGLNPTIEQSGTSVNKSSLSKMGDRRLRKALYMPALVAVKHNSLMSELYQRLLNKGKPKKVALCAVMRKLLVLSYGVLKSEQAFDVNYARQT